MARKRMQPVPKENPGERIAGPRKHDKGGSRVAGANFPFLSGGEEKELDYPIKATILPT